MSEAWPGNLKGGRNAGGGEEPGGQSARPWSHRGRGGAAWRPGGWGKALGAKRRPELEPWKRRKSNLRRVGLGSDRLWETGEGTDEDKVWGSDLATDGATLRWQGRRRSKSEGATEFSKDGVCLRGLGGEPRRAFGAHKRGILLNPGDARSSWRRKFKVLQAPPGDRRHSRLAVSYR